MGRIKVVSSLVRPGVKGGADGWKHPVPCDIRLLLHCVCRWMGACDGSL